jgi:phosphatidylglycerophosphatase A
MSYGELWLILGLVLILFLLRAMQQPGALLKDAPHLEDLSLRLRIAQGFGLGRIPLAPGTFGSVAGVLWFAFLVARGRLWVLVIGTLGGLALSVWLCGVGEKILGKKDPGSIVLDEITAMPLCFWSWAGALWWKTGHAPGLEQFFSPSNWLMTLAVFAAFRFFDVLKPWPVRQSQALPGGWGITVDDTLAAVYVNVLVLCVSAARGLVVG